MDRLYEKPTSLLHDSNTGSPIREEFLADLFGQATQWIRPQWDLIKRLIGHFVRLRGEKFCRELEAHKSAHIEIFFSITLLWLSVTLLGIFVNPLTTPSDTASAVYRTIFSNYSLLIPAVLPMYLSIRAFGGANCFWFVLIVNSVASVFVALVTWMTVTLGVFLSPQITQDLEDIHQGHGRGTAFYQAFCQPIADGISLLKEMTELNNLTGRYDEERILRSSAANAEKYSAYMTYHARLNRLTPAQNARVQFL